MNGSSTNYGGDDNQKGKRRQMINVIVGKI